MPEPAIDGGPSLARRIGTAVATTLIVAAVWWIIEWRSAPPPIIGP
jgi:hypothetical protein